MVNLTKQQQAKFDAQLEKWRQDLVNLTKRNKLLHFRHNKTSSIEVVAPSMDGVATRLESTGWGFLLPPAIEPDDDPGKEHHPRIRAANELETTKKTARDLLNALRGLERLSSQTLLDTGLWVLYLAFGMLRWIDPADGKPYESPLLLLPVRLGRPGQPTDFRLEASEDDPIINPALSIKLANDFGIVLPTIDDVDLSPTSVAEAVRRAVRSQEGWIVEERVVLTTFTFHKEAMYRDLLSNAAAVAEHPLVQLAAVGASAGAERFVFDGPSDEALDTIAAPEDLVSIRDADSTQRKCIIAARDGRSFVMDGPPGTGKSQTITNIIAELLHAGKKVLFVSEKAAALDVVYNRLHDAGLSEFVLPLHSHKATRKDVATELGRALEVNPRARTSFTDTDRATLVNLRKELSDYAMAVNVVRQPLHQSLHQVLGQILQLQHLRQAPVAATVGADLTPQTLGALTGAADRLGRAWGPIVRGDRFLWKSMQDTTVSVSRQQEITLMVSACDSAVDRLQFSLNDVEATTGLGWTGSLREAEKLERLLSIVESHPDRATLPLHWLVGTDLAELATLAEQRRAQVETYQRASLDAEQIGGVSWQEVGPGNAEALATLVDRCTSGLLPIDLGASSDRAWITSTQGLFADVQGRVGSLTADAAVISEVFGLAQTSPTILRCAELAELANFIGSPTPPEPTWLDPIMQAALHEAAAVMTTLVADYRQRRDSLRTIFNDEVLDLDLVALRARLKASAGLKKLGGTYRADKKTLATCVVSGKVNAEVIEQLDQAIAWKELRTQLTSAEGAHSGLLGSYYQGPIDTDFDRADRAIGLAHRAIELCGGGNSAELQHQLALGAHPDAAVLQAGHRLSAAVTSWNVDIAPELRSICSEAPDVAVVTLAEWASATAETLGGIAVLMDSIHAATGRELPIRTSLTLLFSTDAVHTTRHDLCETAADDADSLGPNYRGVATDFAQLHRDLGWGRAVLDAAGEPLAIATAEPLVALGPAAEELSTRLRQVVKTWGAIADLFFQPWRDQLTDDFRVSLDDGRALLAELAKTIGDIDEWCRYADARQELLDNGLAPVVEFLEEQRVNAADVGEVVERSILERWTDAVIAGDPRLKTLAPSERNNLVEQFKSLDRALVANAAAQVINECSRLRPSTALGAAGIIRREAQKKTRQKPIRTLLAETREVALALKPCFMMSPLSVSQFLPPDIGFDVVIFDEASQVRPADAVNCIYRGRQLIVAGDPQQLPPTNFFEQVTEESGDEFDEEAPEDFESVLDIFLGSGLPPLSLQWHYRSQHESLITYSNYRFYRGLLHTFPGAIEHAPDVGIELIPAAGVYRRGGARDNPIEAAKVVERILFHRRNHPELTIGVVAFSTAQESAIVAEIERLSSTEPELRALVTTDRLDGFFVKNLENVQGDERDVIIFSIGYGPDEHGKFTEQLGPLGKQGGQRRLNVAITRARRRVEVVSSVRAADFPGTSAAEGIRHLQRYLDFAERGIVALALDLNAAGGDAESPFEEAVLSFLSGCGYDVVPQVGVAGYRIDMAIRHPDRPGEFSLGIECDGAAYHSSRVARDRDRLRQEVLEGLGWRIHRIWGTSWFRDRRTQEGILRAAIDDAIAGRVKTPAYKQVAAPRPVIELAAVDLDERPNWAAEYTVSHWRPAYWFGEIHAIPRTDLVAGVEAIVVVEGPIHEDVLRRRLADGFDVQRIGNRIKEAFDEAITSALRKKSVTRHAPGFLSAPTVLSEVRVPGTDERTARTVAQIASSERQNAISLLVGESQRVSRDDLRSAFGRLFGWRRIGADIEAAFEKDLKQLVKDGKVQVDPQGFVTVGR